MINFTQKSIHVLGFNFVEFSRLYYKNLNSKLSNPEVKSGDLLLMLECASTKRFAAP